jgi:plasmid stabilization system protein ParE
MKKKTPKPTLSFTDQAERDIKRCLLFLERKRATSPARRIREIRAAARRIPDSPKLYPIEEVHAVSRLEFRRKIVGQFVIIYALLEPTSALPYGGVSIRRVRHAAEEDVLFRVEERREPGVPRSHGLSTRHHFGFSL